MGYPRFYRAYTQDAEHPEQQMFYLTRYPEHEEAARVAPGGTAPTPPNSEDAVTECNQIEHACLSVPMDRYQRYMDKWDKLPLEVIDVREIGFKSAYARVSLHYALDKELQQLFDFLHFEERLRHSSDMAHMQKKISDRTAARDTLRKMYTEAMDRITYLELPWYKKLWIFLTSKQEF